VPIRICAVFKYLVVCRNQHITNFTTSTDSSFPHTSPSHKTLSDNDLFTSVHIPLPRDERGSCVRSCHGHSHPGFSNGRPIGPLPVPSRAAMLSIFFFHFCLPPESSTQSPVPNSGEMRTSRRVGSPAHSCTVQYSGSASVLALRSPQSTMSTVFFLAIP